MTAIDILLPRARQRRWQAILIDRLRGSGHDVSVTAIDAPPTAWPWAADGILWFERTVLSGARDDLASVVEPVPESRPPRPPALTIDLTGAAEAVHSPVLTLWFDGSTSPATALAALAAGRLPDITIVRDRRTVVATACPMVDNRVLSSRGLDDVLARAITLTMATVSRFERNDIASDGAPPAPGRPASLLAYPVSALPRLGREVLRRTRYRDAHWRVGYRFAEGPGVGDTGELGAGWSVLPDDGDRFYADPFPFEWEGRFFVFVEDYPHGTRKAVISVAEFDAGGRLEPPRPILEEPHHLSYPQVFSRDGEIWMIPESSAGRNLVLYRAERFPDRWARHKVLIAGRELADATLLEHGGKSWLFATERDGFGSTSDTLVVFFADTFEGPWQRHQANPILIDRTAARPGGAFIKSGGRVILPVQNGTLGYGGGLGFAELVQLDTELVRMSAPEPIAGTGAWPYPKIHTYNRAGRLEVIDGIADVRKRR